MKQKHSCGLPGAITTRVNQLHSGSHERDEVLSSIAQLSRASARPRPVVFATKSYQRMAREVVASSEGWLKLGDEERKVFPDGRPWKRFVTDVAGREAILIGGAMTDAEFMELYKMAYNAWRWEADSITIVMPYHGDARQERWKLPGESIDALYSSAMFGAIPKKPRVFLVDIHADKVTGFFEGAGMQCTNLPVLPHLIRYVAEQRFGGVATPTAPDAGRAKIVEDAAKEVGWNFAIAPKSRSGNQTKTHGLIGDVDDQDVIISDDMGVSFTSAIGAGEQVLAAGARSVVLLTTHGVIPKEKYLLNLKESGIFSALYVTDSLPHVYRLARKHSDFMHVIPLAPRLVPYLLG